MKKPLSSRRLVEVSRIMGGYCRASPEGSASLTDYERQGIADARSRGEGYWLYVDLRDGYSLERPGLKCLEVDIERGKITRVWVADMTRLARDPAVLESIRRYFVQWRVELAVVE